jgi:hypothetical protein
MKDIVLFRLPVPSTHSRITWNWTHIIVICIYLHFLMQCFVTVRPGFQVDFTESQAGPKGFALPGQGVSPTQAYFLFF